LPHYRGAAPINWAIINGETETGVSTFFLDDKIDTGEVILQETVSIEAGDSAGSLHDKLMQQGSGLVLKTLEAIKEGAVNTTIQEQGEGLRSASKLTRENTRINWQRTSGSIYNHIRGLSPYPAAWTMLNNGEDELQMKIYAASLTEGSPSEETGKLVQEGKRIKVATADGFIELLEVQLPGKRKMSIKDLLNGFSFSTNAKVV